MLELREVTKTYQMGKMVLHALNGVTLTVEKGEFVTVMGPSGSGKSTLLHILGILDRPSSGQYFYDGRDVTTFSDREMATLRNREIGFVFQGFNLLSEDDALRNVSLPLLYGRVPEPQVKAAKALEAVGLADRAHHRPFELSGGEQQRVAIARALVKNPSVILADEPTGNLDTRAGGAIMDLLSDLHDKGITLVVITHDDQVAARGSRQVRIVDGKIQAGGGEG